MTTDDQMHQIVQETIERRQAALEEVCELALAGGQHGVLIEIFHDGGWTVSVSEYVPYGYCVTVPPVRTFELEDIPALLNAPPIPTDIVDRPQEES